MSGYWSPTLIRYMPLAKLCACATLSPIRNPITAPAGPHKGPPNTKPPYAPASVTSPPSIASDGMVNGELSAPIISVMKILLHQGRVSPNTRSTISRSSAFIQRPCIESLPGNLQYLDWDRGSRSHDQCENSGRGSFHKFRS